MKIPKQQIKQAFRKLKERTYASPSNIHMGQYNVLLTVDGEKYTDREPDPEEFI